VEFGDPGVGVTIGGWSTDEQKMVAWLDEFARVVDLAVSIHEG